MNFGVQLLSAFILVPCVFVIYGALEESVIPSIVTTIEKNPLLGLVIFVATLCALIITRGNVARRYVGRAMTLEVLYSLFEESPMILFHLRGKIFTPGGYHALVGIKSEGTVHFVHINFQVGQFPTSIGVNSAMRAVRQGGQIVLQACEDPRTGIASLPEDIQLDLAEVMAR